MNGARKMQTHEEVKRELLADEEVRAEYERLEDEFALRRAMIQLRNASGMSQRAVAEKLGTYQSALSRLESGRTNVSLDYLARLADALDSDVSICFTPRSGENQGQRIEARVKASSK
jgi:DNA-binding XRE family transcriptional regulator